MKARRIELSIPIEAGTLPDPEAVVPVFHAIIRDGSLGEVLVDVARYGHVKNAPAVVLVGHASDYVIEVTPEGLRFAAVRKRDAAPDDRRLLDVAERLLAAAQQVQAALPAVRFRTDELRIRVLDRLNAPNTPETFRRLSDEVGAFARRWLGEVTLEPGADPSAPLEIWIRRGKSEPLSALSARLARPAEE
ncbi:MAG: hypothetical protein HYZ29_14625 [Myxococcales bacterium]|nr:hypothetical protein [Myxococcales bacterium]